VKRERNPDDRRAYVITLTAAGKRMQARGEEAVDAHALQFFGQLSEPERQELHRLLARLIEGVARGVMPFRAAGRTWRPLHRCAMIRS
jgi:DNA-binding MarR family transcriptional regulator